MAYTQNAKANVITKNEWFDQVINTDGGSALIEKLGYEPQNRKNQGEDKKTSFTCKQGTYLFAVWNTDYKGNAIAFYAYLHNLDRKTQWNEITQGISDLLCIQNYIRTKNAPIQIQHKSKSKQVIQKKAKATKQAKFTILDYSIQFKETFTKEELNYWAVKTSCNDLELLQRVLISNKVKSVKSATITRKYENNAIPTIQKIENLNFVFAIETIDGVNEYRLIQPKCNLGIGYFLAAPVKRAAFPNFDKTKKLCPNWQFAMGLNSLKDLSKPIILASGETDYLTLRVHGFQAVCLGGEGMKFNDYSLEIMRENGFSTKDLSILFDNDANAKDFKGKNTGLEFAKKLSSEYQIPYLSIPTLEGIKDVSDFFAASDGKNDFERFVLNLTHKREFKIIDNQKIIRLNESYLSKDLAVSNEIVNEILTNNITILDCGAGVGKTYFSLKFLPPLLKAKGKKNILFAVPTTSLAQQIEKEYNLIALYANKDFYPQQVVDGQPIVSVYDSVVKYTNHITPDVLIIDEAHMMASESSYRSIMNNIFELTLKNANLTVVLLSATHSQNLVNEYTKVCEKTNKKLSYIYVKNEEKNNIQIVDNSYELGGSSGKDELIASITNELKEKPNHKIVVYNNNKTMNNELRTHFIKEFGLSQNQVQFFFSYKEKGKETGVMKAIRETGFIQDEVRLVFVTSIFLQGINVYNENVSSIIYAAPNRRQKTADIIQFVNRFRKASDHQCRLIIPKIDKVLDYNYENAKIDYNYGLTNKAIEDVNLLPKDFEREAFINKNKGVVIDVNMFFYCKESETYKSSKVFVANKKDNAFLRSLNNENYFKQIVKNGRGIVLGGQRVVVEIDKAIESMADYKGTCKVIKDEILEMENQIFTEMAKDPCVQVNLIIEKTADEKLKKEIRYFFKPSHEQKNTSLDIKCFGAYDLIEKYNKRKVSLKKINESLENKEIVEMLSENKTNRDFKKLRNSLGLAQIHLNRNEIIAKGNNKDGYFAFKELENVVLFQKECLKIFGRECQDTFNKTYDFVKAKSGDNADVNEIKKRCYSWNKAKFIEVLKEHLTNLDFTLFDVTNLSDYDLLDLLDIFFEIDCSQRLNYEVDGKKKTLRIITKFEAKYDWQ